MLESQFSTKFSQWFFDNKSLFPHCVVFEYKVAKGNSFNLKIWRDGRQGHQAIALSDAKIEKGVYHKISDQSSGVKPFDAFFISRIDESYLVIYFEKYKEFFCIPESVLSRKKIMQYSYCKKYLPTYKLKKKEAKKVYDF